ncbi:parvulin-like peptidyl-prolyl isomerase [Pseudomonas knackmussii B13]|uniref:peptidylprolyl isomerase n=1 Tax=Pseudomonas knackmussii (strain DSM 6978 / CCUG 54928 / LMG 23759 / B13) TaxID=1301098 RepID=A0A024HG33_PSEKB|nr:peptidylprolyl isomerase [Pseudomonas knackmussii]CDF83423.1 parvulin-like peptidyl-prolyl isomerase [Pseudomonas knackmussii B13]
MKRLWLGLLALLGVLAAQADEPLAARVNGVGISDWRLQRYFEEYLATQGRSLGAIRSPTLYGRLRDEALEQLIDRELLWQEAGRRGLLIDEATLDAAVEERRLGFGGAENFSRRLGDAGFDEASYREYLRHELAAQRMYAELSKAEPPSEADVRSFYAARREQLRSPETLRARHILLPAESAEDERRARNLAAQLRAGADFAALARQRSRDASAGAGGDLGYFPRGAMVPEFELVAFASAPGELAGPVRSRYGWHLIRVEEHRAAREPDEKQALAAVRTWLERQRTREAGQLGLRQLREQAHIERAERGGFPASGEALGQTSGASPPELGKVAGMTKPAMENQ